MIMQNNIGMLYVSRKSQVHHKEPDEKDEDGNIIKKGREWVTEKISSGYGTGVLVMTDDGKMFIITSASNILRVETVYTIGPNGEIIASKDNVITGPIKISIWLGKL